MPSDDVAWQKPIPAEGGLDDDAADLARLGVHKQELKRNFNTWSLAFMCFCNNGVWEAFTATSAQALTSGGSSSMIWGYLLMGSGALIVSLCISEYASMIPTAGGQYHYVAYMSPPRLRRIFSWYAGWLTTWAWLLSSIAGNFATCMQISAYMILFRKDYEYKTWHTSLTMAILMTIYMIISIYGIKYLHHTSFVAMAAHTVGFIATIIYLLVKTDPKAPAKDVFGSSVNLTGWESDGVAWCIGLLAPAAAIIGWDSSTHMAEEMKHASRDLPKTMWLVVLITGIVTFPWVIGLMFCIPDITSFLQGPVARISPMVQLMYNVSGGDFSATVGMTIFVPIIGFTIAGPGCISATSRIIFSLAREGAFPPIFAKVDKTWNVPIYSILATWFIMAAVPMIYIGNSTAYYTLASGGSAVYILGYAFPLAVRLIWGMEQSGLEKGPFTLGRYSRPLAMIALGFCAFLLVFMCFPTLMPATAVNANYSAVVLVFGAVFMPTVTWFLYGRRTYHGVVENLDGTVGLQGDGHGVEQVEVTDDLKKYT